MRGLSSRSFFARWQSLYAASNPGLLLDRWSVDGVDWIKERHIHWGAALSFQLEIHRLECRAGPRLAWSLLVVTERWWGPERDKCIRETSWARALSGKPDRILAWLKRQQPLS